MTVDKKNIDKGLQKIEKKYAWSFLGFILAAIFGSITIYTTFIVDKQPDLNITITSNVRVLDINANVQELDIFYKNDNIIKQGKNLSILTLKVENSSNLDILSNFYDNKNPLGIELINATIVEKPEIIEASNEYLLNKTEIFQHDSLNSFTFSEMIIDKHQYFTLKLLLLHKSDIKPIIQPIGKIAGVEQIDVIYQTSETILPFWKRLLQGKVGIHVLRFFFYLISLVVIVFVIILPPFLISDAISTKKKKKLVLKYKKGKNLKSTNETDLLFELFIDNSKDYLLEIQRYFRNKDELKEEIELIINYVKNNLHHRKDFIRVDESARRVAYESDSIIEELYKKKIVQIIDKKLNINEIFEKELNEFLSFLKLI